MIKSWLEKTIVGLDLCPFTRKPFEAGKILIEDLSAQNTSEALDQFLSRFSLFQAQTFFETALFAFPLWKISFLEFNNFMGDCENQLEALGLEDQYQLVPFHPDFIFGSLAYSDRSNLVNSSPVPLIHVLRSVDLELIDLSTHEAETMSFNNSKKLKMMSESELHSHFPWRKRKEAS